MKRRALPKLALLALGTTGMMLYTGDWRVWPFAWITPVVLLYLVRSSRLVTGLLPLFLMAVGVACVARQGMSPVGDWVSMLIGSTIFAVTFCIPYLLDRGLYGRLPGFAVGCVVFLLGAVAWAAAVGIRQRRGGRSEPRS